MTWWRSGSGSWNSYEPDYNEHFQSTVRLIRDFFKLKKVKDSLGYEETTDFWLPYTLQEEDYLVQIISFRWNEVARRNGYWTPFFRLHIRIVHDTPDRKVLFDKIVFMEFPDRFPLDAPLFRVKSWRYRLYGYLFPHNHHMYVNGMVCIDWDHLWKGGLPKSERAREINVVDMAAFLYKGVVAGGGVTSGQDTVISALHVLFSWIVWHVTEYGF